MFPKIAHHRLRILSALLLSLIAVPLAVEVEAAPKTPSPGRHLHRNMHGPQGFLTTNRYRPRIRFTVGEASSNRISLAAKFSTLSGHIDRIETRIDGQIVGTIRPGKQLKSGTLETAVDLSKIGPGKHKLVLWVWQGRPGYQRLHGESKSYKFTR
jgi:hypothetical protein